MSCTTDCNFVGIWCTANVFLMCIGSDDDVRVGITSMLPVIALEMTMEMGFTVMGIPWEWE